MCGLIDISEDWLLSLGQDILATLLKDRTTDKNIIWATNDYESRGEGYGFHDQITIEKITGENHGIIRPRITKTQDQQRQRSRDKAEVFTPSWVCNAQNNLIDEAWFGRKDVFNTVSIAEDGSHTWQPTPSPITFPEGKTWLDYVKDTRMEITCGEAPYLASRYDTTTGLPIPLSHRIGLLDRKLRVISENVDDPEEWMKMANLAYTNIYGYEWQGDNLLLARETLFVTFIEYCQDKFGMQPDLKSLFGVAYIISWNLWQMDGLKFCLPGQEPIDGAFSGLFEEDSNMCMVMDWEKNKPIKFKTLVKS